MIVKIRILVIKKPWYGAWKKFGWDKSVWGVGLKKSSLETALRYGYTMVQVNIEQDKSSYLIGIKQCLEFAEKNNTYFTAKQGVILAVVPETELVETNNAKEN